jgi:hypothetical protein
MATPDRRGDPAPPARRTVAISRQVPGRSADQTCDARASSIDADAWTTGLICPRDAQQAPNRRNPAARGAALRLVEEDCHRGRGARYHRIRDVSIAQLQ